MFSSLVLKLKELRSELVPAMGGRLKVLRVGQPSFKLRAIVLNDITVLIVVATKFLDLALS
jgi:hypothetical protein